MVISWWLLISSSESLTSFGLEENGFHEKIRLGRRYWLFQCLWCSSFIPWVKKLSLDIIFLTCDYSWNWAVMKVLWVGVCIYMHLHVCVYTVYSSEYVHAPNSSYHQHYSSCEVIFHDLHNFFYHCSIIFFIVFYTIFIIVISVIIILLQWWSFSMLFLYQIYHCYQIDNNYNYNNLHLICFLHVHLRIYICARVPCLFI